MGACFQKLFRVLLSCMFDPTVLRHILIRFFKRQKQLLQVYRQTPFCSDARAALNRVLERFYHSGGETPLLLNYCANCEFVA